MKIPASSLALALILTSCSVFNPPRDEAFKIDPSKVEFQAKVAADAPLNISIEVFLGGCRGFDRFEAVRTASQLQLNVIGKERVGNGVACNTGIVKNTYTYTDSGTPTRINPFEIIVNDKSYGTITIK